MHYTLGFIAQSFTEGVLECNGMYNHNHTTDDNKNHQNGLGEHVSNYWWCEN